MLLVLDPPRREVVRERATRVVIPAVRLPPQQKKKPKANALAVRRAKRMAKRLKKPPLSLRESERLENKVQKVTPSKPWTEHAAREADYQGISPVSTRVLDLLLQYHIFPPPAEHARMLPCHCRHCKGVRLWPANYVGASGYSQECWYEKMTKARADNLSGSCSKVHRASDGAWVAGF